MLPSFSIPRLQLQKLTESPSKNQSPRSDRSSSRRSAHSERKVSDRNLSHPTARAQSSALPLAELASARSESGACSDRTEVSLNAMGDSSPAQRLPSRTLDQEFLPEPSHRSTTLSESRGKEGPELVFRGLDSARSSSSNASSLDDLPVVDATKAYQPALPGGGLGLSVRLKGLQEPEPESEDEIKRKKLAYFDKQMSEVYPGLFVIGQQLAKDAQALKDAGITHIVNCVGMNIKPQFPDDFDYLTLYVEDDAREDIASLLYTVFNKIEKAILSGGKACIHCSQGVSRSITFAIAYIMWRTKEDYASTFQAVKAIRGVANPNLGFTAQLMRWHRLHNRDDRVAWAYQIEKHNAKHIAKNYAPNLVAREIREDISKNIFKPDNVVILRTAASSYLWEGPESRLSHRVAARRTYGDMRRYENAPFRMTAINSTEDLPSVLEQCLATKIHLDEPVSKRSPVLAC